MNKGAELITKNKQCRACQAKNLVKILSLGKTPAANAFLREQDLSKPEPLFPLELYFCTQCWLVQLTDIVSAEYLFKDYVYVSSTSPVFVAHFQKFAEEVIDKLSISQDALIVDIGSNDGILLRPFKEKGRRVLGIDPAEKIAQQATREGIETLPYFFTPQLAREIVAKYGQAELVTGTNVFAHINDLDSVLEGVKILLKPQGAFIIEAPYLVDFLEKNLFDTVYHEHLSYFSLSPLTVLFNRLGMEVFDVDYVPSHGGSVRVFSQIKGAGRVVGDSVKKMLADEERRGLGGLESYQEFAQRVERNKNELLRLLKKIKKENKKIVGYGAPAKGNTLLNYFGIGREFIDYIVDDSEWKQGLYTPGTRIPVVAYDVLERDNPDYIFILAWNFAQPIMDKLSGFKDRGVKFVIPVPNPRVV